MNGQLFIQDPILLYFSRENSFLYLYVNSLCSLYNTKY